MLRLTSVVAPFFAQLLVFVAVDIHAFSVSDHFKQISRCAAFMRCRTAFNIHHGFLRLALPFNCFGEQQYTFVVVYGTILQSRVVLFSP